MNFHSRPSKFAAADAALWAEVEAINAEHRARMADPEKRRAYLQAQRAAWWDRVWDTAFNDGAQFDADANKEKEAGL